QQHRRMGGVAFRMADEGFDRSVIGRNIEYLLFHGHPSALPDASILIGSTQQQSLGGFAMPDSSNVYAGVAGYFGKPDHPGKVGVFQRASKGGDWKHVLGSVQAFTVFVHPANPETVFAGTNDGVWRS